MKKGFTALEVVIIVGLIVILLMVALPNYERVCTVHMENDLHSDLMLVRKAIASFKFDTSVYPLQLSDLTATSAPAQGRDDQGEVVNIDHTAWHGPYLSEVPNDAVSCKEFVYTVKPPVGLVRSSAEDNALNGTAYNTW